LVPKIVRKREIEKRRSREGTYISHLLQPAHHFFSKTVGTEVVEVDARLLRTTNLRRAQYYAPGPRVVRKINKRGGKWRGEKLDWPQPESPFLTPCGGPPQPLAFDGPVVEK